MSITLIKEQPNCTGDVGDDGAKTYRRQFIAISDNHTDGPLTVRAALLSVHSVARGTVYNRGGSEIDVTAICTRIDVRETNESTAVGGSKWLATADYSTTPPQDPDEEEDNPLARPAEISYDFALFAGIAEKDKDDTEIKNTAGDPYDPPIEREDARLILTIVRNEAFYNLATAQSMVNAVNKTAWNGGAARTWKCQNISAQRMFENDVVYWRVTYQFAYKADTYDVEVISRGFFQKDNDKRVMIFVLRDDADPKSLIPTPVPQPLDANGAHISDPTDDLYFQTFKIYDEYEFNSTGL